MYAINKTSKINSELRVYKKYIYIYIAVRKDGVMQTQQKIM